MQNNINLLAEACLYDLVEYGRESLALLSDSAKLDAQLLLAFVLKKETSYLLTWPEKKLNATQFTQFQQLLERRKKNEPVAYILGFKEFWSLPLSVEPSTLIPRPDTETLVEQILASFSATTNKSESCFCCLDLGTGTGAIALALASEMPHWHIEAVDFSIDAVALANKNAQILNLSHIKIYQSDWFSQIGQDKKFDVIVSNPPYIDENDEHLSQGDVQFEPASALVAKNNGLADIVTIATQARTYLQVGGQLYLEHGYKQAVAVQKILQDLGYDKISTNQDLSGNDRITWAVFNG